MKAACAAQSKKIFNCAALLGFLLLGPVPLHATEGAGSSYPVGNELAYANMRAPGTYYLMYYNYYAADSLKGINGKDNPVFSKFRIKSNGVAFRFQHVWQGKFLGAGMQSVFAAPFALLDVAKVNPAGTDSGDKVTGAADGLLIPLLLGWQGKTYSQALSLEFAVPQGNYDKNARVNTGRNYWQYAPTYAFNFRPVANVEADAKLRYAFNCENVATHYKSGDEFTVEFLAGYRPEPSTAAGLQGFYYLQTTNDELRGKATAISGTGIGNRGEITAVGPYVSHIFSKAFTATLKYQHEFNAYNRPQGDRFWFQALLPF